MFVFKQGFVGFLSFIFCLYLSIFPNWCLDFLPWGMCPLFIFLHLSFLLFQNSMYSTASIILISHYVVILILQHLLYFDLLALVNIPLHSAFKFYCSHFAILSDLWISAFYSTSFLAPVSKFHFLFSIMYFDPYNPVPIVPILLLIPFLRLTIF